MKKSLKQQDPTVWKLIQAEAKRQQLGLELIPSENYVSSAILEATGSILTNKYSEGYPRKRYYGGQKIIDQVEELAQKRLLKLFKLNPKIWHANVQPYSGSPANMAVYVALVPFGETIMGQKLVEGGHLTHGHKVNFSGKAYNAVQYSLDPKTGRLNYNEIAKLAREHKPKLIIYGATAYPRKIDFKKFGEIAKSIGAIHFADISHIAGLIVGGAHPSPFAYADVVMTTTHKTLRGPRSAVIMCRTQFASAIDKAVFPGLQGGPHEHTIAAKAVCFQEAMQPSFKKYAKQIVKNAKVLANELRIMNYELVSGGTDNHLLLINLTPKNITGDQAQTALDEVGITVNKNTIPNEPRSPFDPSGIRLGTPAITTRGMKEKEMALIARLMHEALANMDSPKELKKFRQEVTQLAKRFPVPGI
ncbi:serine hydroxymethyltransferase [Candidatus Berkelbacteria bacterium]|nr:serine hydroxymethyltransferase [Candidatus Berkelbacteria bacterium]